MKKRIFRPRGIYIRRLWGKLGERLEGCNAPKWCVFWGGISGEGPGLFWWVGGRFFSGAGQAHGTPSLGRRGVGGVCSRPRVAPAWGGCWRWLPTGWAGGVRRGGARARAHTGRGTGGRAVAVSAGKDDRPAREWPGNRVRRGAGARTAVGCGGSGLMGATGLGGPVVRERRGCEKRRRGRARVRVRAHEGARSHEGAPTRGQRQQRTGRGAGARTAGGAGLGGLRGAGHLQRPQADHQRQHVGPVAVGLRQ